MDCVALLCAYSLATRDLIMTLTKNDTQSLSERLAKYSHRPGFEIISPAELSITTEDATKYCVESCLVSARVRNNEGVVVVSDHKIVPVAFFGHRHQDILGSGYFQSKEEAIDFAQKKLSKKILAAKERECEKAKARAEALELVASTQVGDVFYSSWGYEQTNVDFYQVVSKKGKQTLVFREIKEEQNYTGDMNGLTVPRVNEFLDDDEYTVIVKAFPKIKNQLIRPLEYKTVMNGAVRIYEPKSFSTWG